MEKDQRVSAELTWRSPEELILSVQMTRADRYIAQIEEYLGREFFEGPDPDETAEMLETAVESYHKLADYRARLFVAERLADDIIELTRYNERSFQQRLLSARSAVADATLDYRGEIVPVDLPACSDCTVRPAVFTARGQCVLCYLEK